MYKTQNIESKKRRRAVVPNLGLSYCVCTIYWGQPPRFVPWKFLVSSVCAGGASCKPPFDRNQKVYHCQARQWRQSGSCWRQMSESSSAKSGFSLLGRLKPKDVKHLPNSVPYPGTVAMTMIKHLRHKTVRWDFHLLSHHLQAGSVLKGAMRLFFHEESISTQTD